MQDTLIKKDDLEKQLELTNINGVFVCGECKHKTKLNYEMDQHVKSEYEYYTLYDKK